MAMAEQRFGKPPLSVNFVQRRGCATAPRLVDQSVGRPGTYYADAIDGLVVAEEADLRQDGGKGRLLIAGTSNYNFRPA